MRVTTGIAIAIIVSAVSSQPAAAQGVVAGWEGGDRAGFAFIAPTASFAVTASQSVLLRATASILYYNSEADGPTDVKAPGASVAIGYRRATSRVNFSVFGGVEQRRLNRQWERGASVSAETFVSVTRLTQVTILGTFAQANRYAWGRIGAKQQLTNTDFQGPGAISIGIETTAQGNRDVTTRAVGAVLEHAWLRSGASLQFRGGYSKSVFPSGNTQQKPYFGIGLYKRL